MFLPFEQDRDSDDPYQEGTGLGLYICKNLVELMGGTISCTSHVGAGTEFKVVLTYPLATDEQISLHTHQSEKYEDHILYGKTVLLAEDNTINAEVIIKLLKTKGIHAEVARDGQEAIDMFKNRDPYHYQAIFMDLMMPVKSGLEAAKEIRAMEKPDAAVIPIFALTADMANDVENRCICSGMDQVLEKPIDQNKLFSSLAKAIQKQLDES